MTSAPSMTQADLIDVLSRLRDRPAIDSAVAERAAALAREIEDGVGETSVTARIVRRGAADYAVVVAPAAEAAIADAIASMARRVP